MTVPTRALTDTVVVVTGAGGGIGGATVRLALEAGARVVAGDLREEALAGLRDEQSNIIACQAACLGRFGCVRPLWERERGAADRGAGHARISCAAEARSLAR